MGLCNRMGQFLKLSTFSHLCLSFYPSFIYLLLSICLSVCLLSICLLPIYRSTYYLCVRLSLCLPIRLLLALLLWEPWLLRTSTPQKAPARARRLQVQGCQEQNPPAAARSSSWSGPTWVQLPSWLQALDSPWTPTCSVQRYRHSGSFPASVRRAPSSAHEASPAGKSRTPASPLILFTPKVKLEPQSSAQGPTDPYSVWTLPAKPAGWPRRCPAASVRPHTPGNAMLHTRVRTG